VNHTFLFQASPDDDMSKFICVDCLKEIKTCGNITYGLWTTIDYLVRMFEEKEVSDE
jgi:hypothetical protein